MFADLRGAIPDDVPSYPAFRRFEFVADRHWYDRFYREFPAYADWCIGNILLWLDFHEDVRIANHEGNLVFRYTSVLKDEHEVVSILGWNVTDAVVNRILDDLEAAGMAAELCEVAEPCIRDLSPHRFAMSVDHDSTEYVYATSDLAALSGRAYRKIRKEVSRFDRSAGGRVELSVEDHLTEARAAEVVEAVSGWGYTKQARHGDNFEPKVLLRSLAYFNDLPMRLLIVQAAGEPAAYALFQALPQGAAVTVNHLKCDYSMPGAFRVASHYLATTLASEGITTMNYEQDLGIGGLRIAKWRLRPDHLLQKYFVRRKIMGAHG